MQLKTELAPRHKSGLQLKNPVMTAAGTFGYGTEYAKIAEIQRLGAIICKGTTLHARSGSMQPRIIETASGLLNANSLQNPGIHTVVKRFAPIWSKWQTPVIVNIAGDSIEEIVEVAEYLEGIEGVAGIEINVAYPDMRLDGAVDGTVDGIVFGTNPETVAEITTAVRSSTTLPLIVKLSPNRGDMRPAAIAAAASGADAISLINTIAGMQIDLSTRRPAFGNVLAGLSGPAIKPIALRMVYEVASELRTTHDHIPIIGIGGISTANDALEFLMAGASAIQIGTINFVNPHAGIDILEGIETFLQHEGVTDVREIIGVAL
jgi:dihydroorotate dehydrogenase (NAD+) catalytic subunit